MSYLIEKKRRNPETDRTETYFRLGSVVDGRQQTVALGFMSRREAERLLKIHEGNVAAQREEAQRRTALPSSPATPSVADFVTRRFLPHVAAAGLAAKSVVSADTSAAHICRLMGSLRVGLVGAPDVDAYIAARQREGVRSRTIHIELGHLRQMLQLAVTDGLLARCPAIQKPRRTDRKPHRYHSPEQSVLLLGALSRIRDASAALAIHTAMELGMRAGEIMSRRWSDVRWEQGRCGSLWVGERLDGEGRVIWTTKTRQGRTIPLTAGLRDALRRQWVRLGSPEDGWVFASSRKPGAPLATFKIALRRACELAGIPVIHPHGLRHSWATRLAITGVPKAVAMGLGGWSSPAMLEGVYQHSISRLEVDAIQQASLTPPEAGPVS